jgi:hypothetical protein
MHLTTCSTPAVKFRAVEPVNKVKILPVYRKSNLPSIVQKSFIYNILVVFMEEMP